MYIPPYHLSDMSEVITCMILEDDLVAQMVIEKMIKEVPFLELRFKSADPFEAIEYLKAKPIDLIFLDIELPQMNGMQFVNLLALKPYLVIISSEQKYAIDAFSYSVVDYLLKPVTDKVRFLQAAYKVKALLENNHLRRETEKPENLFVRADSLLQNIPLDSILWLEASGDYVKINTDKKMLMVLSTMKAISEKLPENKFVRVHRSFIVNIKRVENIDSSNLIIGNKIIPISTNYRDSLMAKINIL